MGKTRQRQCTEIGDLSNPHVEYRAPGPVSSRRLASGVYPPARMLRKSAQPKTKDPRSPIPGIPAPTTCPKVQDGFLVPHA